jgi:excisionase family DNA binding protein
MTEWLTLSEAADELGVHPSTLRRWTDEGRVPARRTPGGHRRYAKADIDGYAATTSEHPAEGSEPHHAVDLHYDWGNRFAEEEIAEMRHLGQRLLGLMIQYISLPEGGRRFLQEGRAIGRRYGAESATTGMALLALMEAFIFFRSYFTNMTVQQPNFPRSRDPEEMVRLFRRIDRYMNEVLLGTVEGYTEHAS